MILTIANRKGGTGKTTTSINLSAGLVAQKQKVLLIDFDPQRSISKWLKIDPESIETICDVLKETCDISSAIQKTKRFDLIISDNRLSGIETVLNNKMGREYILKKILEPIKDQYDFIIIDTPPSSSLLTMNALIASDQVINAATADYLNMSGIVDLFNMVKLINDTLNLKLNFAGLVISHFDKRKNGQVEVLEMLIDQFGSEAILGIIRTNVALADTVRFGKTIFEYQKYSHGGLDFEKLSKTIIKRFKG
jgi:chromosome partitioning protein